MKPFLDENFLLENEVARQLYHDHAKNMPIIDYHNHLSPRDLAEDRKFDNLTQAWLEGDHYKWRAMRTNGVNEHYITGDAGDREKFQKWAETVPYTLRNPLYHWAHLELQRYFGITTLLNPKSGQKIYEEANGLLDEDEMSCRGILKKMKVEVVCTTDDPVDDLEYHKKIKADGFSIQVLPAFRPDKAYTINDLKGYNRYLDSLSKAADLEISSYEKLLQALEKRIAYFATNGCKLADHGLEQLYDVTYSKNELSDLFNQLRAGKEVSFEGFKKFKQGLLTDLSELYFQHNWVQQYHLGPLRNNNTRMVQKLGPDTGFDSIGDFSQAKGLAKFLDGLDKKNSLTKTILYNLNPGDNAVIATMTGNFNDGSIPGKMQLGSAWWFLDQKNGMEAQINTLSNMGLLSRFVGMLTDSRSFLSFPRHEYFRRILCNLLGKDVANGELPHDMQLLGDMVKNVCYYNARSYFGFDSQ